MLQPYFPTYRLAITFHFPFAATSAGCRKTLCGARASYSTANVPKPLIAVSYSIALR